MKVVHLSTRDSIGGAFRGTYTLHQGLLQAGVDSHLLVARKYTQDPTVHLQTAPLASRLLQAVRMVREEMPLKAYPNRTHSFFSPSAVSANLRPALHCLNPDVIHLHWVEHGFVRPEDLSGWKRPLVWTMRDMWAFTGGCHYNQGCDRYHAHCGRCPQLGSNDEQDISYSLMQRKLKSWKNFPIHFVAISHWLAECARTSSVFAGHSVQVIPNAIDTQLFAPQPKQAAREQWNLPPDKKIILFGALAIEDDRKGYSHVAEAAAYLAQQPNRDDLHIVTFGEGEPSKIRASSLPVTHLGYIPDNRKLSALYSAADVMLVPSLEEAFGKTAAEALGCGTPVVCFNASGVKDIVEHQQCGYCAKPFSSEDLAAGIAWVLADDERHASLASRGRAKVLAEFSLSQVAKQYKTLYAQIIKDQAQMQIG